MISFRILFGVFLLLSLQFSFCQRAASAKYPYSDNYSDTTKKILQATNEELIIDVRLLSDDLLDKYKNDPEFDYDGGPVEAEDWITKIRNWINQQMILLSSSKTYSTLIDILYYALMILAVILIIRGLIKADRRGLLFGKVNSNELKLSEQDEDISQLNFDDLIASAVESKQFKLAIRYMYLKSLKLLSEKGIIELRNNKTNHQYLSEITNDQVASAFGKITTQFEWIYYGDFSVDEQIVNSSQLEFRQLYTLIIS